MTVSTNKVIRANCLNNLKILYLNARSIKNKLYEIEAYVKSIGDIDIILVTETWLYPNEEKFINLNEFVPVFNSRVERRGGGTLILIKNSIKFNKLDIESNDNSYNPLLIELSNLKFTFKIMLMYRPPDELLSQFFPFIDQQLSTHKNLLVVLDSNIDLLTNGQEVDYYKDIIHMNGFSVLNEINEKNATRVTETSKTLIDHFISNFIQEDCEFSLKLDDVSGLDHKTILLTLDKLQYYNPVKFKTIQITRVNNFRSRVILELQKYSNPDFFIIQKIITEAKSQCVDMKKIKIRKNKWIDEEILQLIEERDSLFKLHKKLPLEENIKRRYKNLKNKVTNLIKEKKSKNVSSKFLNAGKDSRKVWEVINEDLLGTSTAKNNKNSIDKLKVGDQTFTDTLDIANQINLYFSNVGKTLAESIPSTPFVDLEANEKSMFLYPTDEFEVNLAIHNLKMNAAPGPDNITNKDLKTLADIISIPISQAINKCFEDGSFPDCLKNSIVIPIYKSGNKDSAKNYRPIALLNSLGKLFEKLIECRIKNFIKNTIKFDENQFGFQEHSGTESAANEVIEGILDFIDKKYYAAAVFIDLQKAFDTVDHSILLKILERLGIRGTALKLIESYLTNRKSQVKLGDVISNVAIVLVGVPQGSILGPLLYLLYIHNMKYAKLKGRYKIFADDTVLIYEGENEQQLNENINSDLCRYKSWANGNKLTLNADKTKVIIFKIKNKPEIQAKVFIDKVNIQRVPEIRYLGVIIDEKLSWKQHINKIADKITPMIGAIKRSGYFNKSVSNIIYKCCILPHIRYLITTWSQASGNELQRVERIMNKCLKVLYKIPWRTPTTEVYSTTNNLRLNQLIYHDKCLLIYKILNGLIKFNLQINYNSDVHSYNTRRSNHLRTQAVRTSLKKNSLLGSAASTYNNLPDLVKESPNVNTFKKRLVEFIKSTGLSR